jgi:hypothetical protein
MTSMYCYWPFAMLARRSDVLAAEIAKLSEAAARATRRARAGVTDETAGPTATWPIGISGARSPAPFFPLAGIAQ